MGRIDKAKALAEIDKTLEDNPESGDWDLEKSANLLACIVRWAPAKSATLSQARQFAEVSANYSGSVETFAPLLRSLRSQIAADMLDSFEELIHADLFSDFLGQAAYLSKEGYVRAAAVIAGGAMEEHLRLLSAANGVDTHDGAGKPRKASALNADLYSKASVYGKPANAEVDSWQKIRNEAAHGQPDFENNHNKDDIRRMIDGIRSFIGKHPA